MWRIPKEVALRFPGDLCRRCNFGSAVRDRRSRKDCSRRSLSSLETDSRARSVRDRSTHGDIIGVVAGLAMTTINNQTIYENRIYTISLETKTK